MAEEFILIVDDEDLIRRQAEVALRRANYRTATAGDGQAALQIIRQTPPDLLLSDIRMPDMDGLQLFAAARQFQPDLVAVLMTAHGTIDTAIRALQLGVQGFLQKPFTGSELERSIQDALQKSRIVQEAIRLRVLSPLLEARRLLLTDLDIGEFSRSLVQTTARETNLDYCAIFLPDEENPAGLKAEAVFAGPNARFFSPKTFPAIRLAQRAIELNRTLSLRRASQENATPDSDAAVPGVVVAIPLLRADKALGVMLAGRVNIEKSFSPGEREMFEVLAGQLATIVENRRLFKALSEREEHLRGFVGRFVTAQEEEKRQLAHHLQEDIMPLLSTGRKNIQNYLEKAKPGSPGELPATEQKLQTAIGEMRQLLHALRPANLEEFGLAAALRQYVRDLNEEGQCHPTFRLDGPEAPRLDPGVETALFRATQEAVSNACKHNPGKAVEVAVRTFTQRNKPYRVQLEISDSGKGLDLNAVKMAAETTSSGQGMGLIAMQERVLLVGGQCQIESTIGKGTVVTITYDISI